MKSTLRHMPRRYYRECVERDPERADAYFYLGQHYRLRGDPKRSLPDLYKAATLPIPQRSLFQWHYLYHCLVRFEKLEVSTEEACSD